MTVLRQEEAQVVPTRQERLDPQEFFRASEDFEERDFHTSEGLFVEHDFRTKILEQVGSTEEFPDIQLAPFSLIDSATDAQIQFDLPNGHVFEDVSAFCYCLACMLQAQLGGVDGILLNNTNRNLFFVRVNGEVFMIFVYWYDEEKVWSIYALAPPLDESLKWPSGQRVFSATVA